MKAGDQEDSLAVDKRSSDCVCKYCGKVSRLRCKGCCAVWYCSRNCQRSDQASHRSICKNIRKLERYESEKVRVSCENRQKRAVDLIGRKCVVDCLQDGLVCETTWDTGGQLTIVGADWLKTHFPRKKIRPLKDLLDSELEVGAANEGIIPYVGFVDMKFCLNVEANSSLELDVPVLVAKSGFPNPRVGQNIIIGLSDYGESPANIREVIRNVRCDDVYRVLQMIKAGDDDVPNAVCTRSTTIIKPGQVLKVTCKLKHMSDERHTCLYEPVDVDSLPNGLQSDERLIQIPINDKHIKIINKKLP